MERCKNCKFWGDGSSDTNRLTKSCGKIDYVPKAYRGDGASVKEITNLKKFELDAYAHDDSGLTVDVMTGEDFGCVLHEPKQ